MEERNITIKYLKLKNKQYPNTLQKVTASKV